MGMSLQVFTNSVLYMCVCYRAFVVWSYAWLLSHMSHHVQQNFSQIVAYRIAPSRELFWNSWFAMQFVASVVHNEELTRFSSFCLVFQPTGCHNDKLHRITHWDWSLCVKEQYLKFEMHTLLSPWQWGAAVAYFSFSACHIHLHNQTMCIPGFCAPDWYTFGPINNTRTTKKFCTHWSDYVITQGRCSCWTIHSSLIIYLHLQKSVNLLNWAEQQ